METLESWPNEVLVKVFFSTQCEVCRELLPNILKLMETLDNPKFSFEFYGMPLPAESDRLAVELKIATFPTAILYRDGKEIGRAHGHSWRHPSMALHNALLGIQVDPSTLQQR
jgi:thiol-disulfide isomerase/thioredoxin